MWVMDHKGIEGNIHTSPKPFCGMEIASLPLRIEYNILLLNLENREIRWQTFTLGLNI